MFTADGPEDVLPGCASPPPATLYRFMSSTNEIQISANKTVKLNRYSPMDAIKRSNRHNHKSFSGSGARTPTNTIEIINTTSANIVTFNTHRRQWSQRAVHAHHATAAYYCTTLPTVAQPLHLAPNYLQSTTNKNKNIQQANSFHINGNIYSFQHGNGKFCST